MFDLFGMIREKQGVKMILFIKRYFGKDWKFFWTTSKVWKIFICKPSTYFGLKLVKYNIGKKLLRIGRERCSWCGAKQTRESGLFMSASRKGLRCSNKDCMDKPYV